MNTINIMQIMFYTIYVFGKGLNSTAEGHHLRHHDNNIFYFPFYFLFIFIYEFV